MSTHDESMSRISLNNKQKISGETLTISTPSKAPSLLTPSPVKPLTDAESADSGDANTGSGTAIIQPLPAIRSNMLLEKWLGNITTFNGFTGTKPAQEFEKIPWNEACNVLCPEKPAIIEDKKQGQYFIPCLLKEAPLVGNTLEAVIKNGQSTTGKMRSKHHVTEASMLVIDIDGLSTDDFETALTRIRVDGLTYRAYTTHSHGNSDKPGVRARLIIPIDRPISNEEYTVAWHGFDQRYLQGEAAKADSSGANLYQQQGTRCSHPSRVDQAQYWMDDAGVASADTLIEIGRVHVCRQSTKEISAKLPDGIGIGSGIHSEQQSQELAKLMMLLEHIDPDCGYSEWLQVLMAIHHETGGSEEGLELADAWSSKGKKYKGSSDIRAKYRSFQLDTNNPITIATLKKMVSDSGKDLKAICRMAELGFKKLDSKLEVIEPSEPSKDESKGGGNNKTLANELTNASGHPTVPPSDAEVIASLAAMSPMEYDRVRLEKAKELGVQVKTLDDEVKELRNKKTGDVNLPFPEVEPYPKPIVLALLLDEISEIICRFVIVDKIQADAAALWTAHTYLIDIFDISPIALINAPEYGCAKTLFQTLLARMVFRPLPAANASVSAMFRSVELWKPTILFDEADTFFRDNKELQGLVNAGYKRGGYVLRSESTGESFEPRMFSVYSAKSIAGITLEKHLPDSTMSRGIIFNIRRKLPHESVTRMRHAESRMFEIIVSKLTRFAIDYAQQIRRAQPKLPDALSDRDQDNWEALLAIAECAGPEWLNRATTAALELSNTREAHTSSGNELLADIRYIFDSGENPRKISTADLIKALCKDDESPWVTYSFGKPITPRQLAKLLTPYGIKSKAVRLGHSNTPKGYDADQFSDVFARYLPQKLLQQRNESAVPNSKELGGAADNPQHDDIYNLNALLGLDCGVGADKSGDTSETTDEY